MKQQPKKYSRLFKYAEKSSMVQLTMEAIKAREQNLTYGQMKGQEIEKAQRSGHWIPEGYQTVGQREKEKKKHDQSLDTRDTELEHA